MPRLEVPVLADGPTIHVRTWIGTEHEALLDADEPPVPPPFSIRGLVDTGTRMTAVQQALAEGMGVPVHNWITLKSSVLAA
jgi:hypothetical protein